MLNVKGTDRTEISSLENRLHQRMRDNVKIIHKNDSAMFLHLDTHMLRCRFSVLMFSDEDDDVVFAHAVFM